MSGFVVHMLEPITLMGSEIRGLMQLLGWPVTKPDSPSAGRIVGAVNKHSVFLVATAARFVATGTIVLEETMSENIAVVRDLVVLDQYRYGEVHVALMHALQARARTLHATRLEMKGNSIDKVARGFYKRRLDFDFTTVDDLVYHLIPREQLAEAISA